MYRSLMLVLLSLLVCSSVFAAETESSAVVMDEVVVTATRQTEELANIPANVTIVTQEEIARSAAVTVPEVLRGVPGVLVSDVYGSGRSYTVDLRGFGESSHQNTLVLVDGRRINQADLSSVDWSLIPKDRVERIEIVRGGRGSVLYGENATAGVINIITKAGSQMSTVTGAVLGGSYDTFQGDVSASGSTDNLSIALNGNYRTTDGYRDNSDTEIKDFGTNLDYTVSESLFLKLSGGFHDDESGFPGGLKKSELSAGTPRTSSTSPDDYADTEDWYLQGGFQLFLNETSYFEANIATRNRDWKAFSFFGTGNYDGATKTETFSFSPQLVLNQELLGCATNFVLGFDYEKGEQDIHNITDDPGFLWFADGKYELSRELYGYFAHAEIFLNEKLAVSGGVRKSRAEFNFKADAYYDYDGFTWTDNFSASKTLDESQYTLGLNYRLFNNSSVYASYTRSTRFPVLDEFFSYTYNSIDTELHEQTTDGFEAGLRMRYESGTAFSVNLFRLEAEDEIFYNPYNEVNIYGANDNLDGDTVRQGFELTVSQEFDSLLLTGSYTYRYAEIDGGRYNGKEIPNVPEHQWSLGAQKMFGKHVQLGINGTYVGERRFISDFNNDFDMLDDYFYVTSKLSYLLENGSFFVAVNNLLNEEYSEYGVLQLPIDTAEEAFYPSPKVNFVVGAEFRF